MCPVPRRAELYDRQAEHRELEDSTWPQTRMYYEVVNFEPYLRESVKARDAATRTVLNLKAGSESCLKLLDETDSKVPANNNFFL